MTNYDDDKAALHEIQVPDCKDPDCKVHVLVEAKVARIPNCDFPHEAKVPALYDGATHSGQWAYMCQAHFDRYGRGLGMGKGQRLILDKD